MKNVILIKRSPSAIITDGLSSPEETGDALLALNNSIKNLVQLFKETLNLSGTAYKWKEELMESSKRLSKKNKTEMRKNKRKEVKEKKAIARQRLDWLKENNPESFVEQSMDLASNQKVITTIGQWIVEPIKKEPIKTVKLTETKRNIKFDSANTLQNKTKFSKAVSSDSESEKSKMVERKNFDRRSSDSIEPISYSYSVDPFFLTETGENYLSAAIINHEEQNSNKTVQVQSYDDTKYYERKDKKSLIAQRYETNGKEEIGASSDIKRKKNIVGKSKSTTSDKYSTFSDNIKKRNNNVKQTISVEDEKLHPSWLAKQKMKPSIKAFQGKKISFENNSDDE